MPKHIYVCPACQKEFTRQSCTVVVKTPCCSQKCKGNIHPKRPPSFDPVKFWEKIKVSNPNECWEWQAYRSAQGYGKLRYYGNVMGAHRVAYIESHGPISSELFICHKCDNPPCCNPNHLFLGTLGDNSKDMLSKGRGAKGETCDNVKLTSDQVLEIARLYETGEFSRMGLARQFDISQPTIYRITQKITWKHLFQVEKTV